MNLTANISLSGKIGSGQYLELFFKMITLRLLIDVERSIAMIFY